MKAMSINRVLGVIQDGSDSRAKAALRWAFVALWIGMCAASLTPMVRAILEVTGPVQIQIQVGKKAPAPLERPEAWSTLGRKVNTMRVREEVNGVKEGFSAGSWTVLGSCFRINGGWRCVAQCKCGRTSVVSTSNLSMDLSQKCKSCCTAERNVKHFSTYTSLAKQNRSLHGVWSGMKDRCHNRASFSYCNYGGRGISVCADWRHSFDAFCIWALSSGYRKGLTIDRRDVNGNYEPGNCRFLTNAEQQRNKTTNLIIHAFGETKPLCAWAEDERCVVGVRTLRSRLNYGWDPEAAIITDRVAPGYSQDGAPTSKSQGRVRRPIVAVDYKAISAWGDTKSLDEWLLDVRCRAKRSTLYRRLSFGWPPEQALENTPWRRIA